MKHLILLILISLFSFTTFGQEHDDSLKIGEQFIIDSISINDYSVSDNHPWIPSDIRWRSSLNAFVFSAGYQHIRPQFKNFSEFAADDLFELNRMNHFVGLKLGGYYNNYYLEAGFYGGGAINEEPYPDNSLNRTSFGWNLNTSFGYGFATRNLRLIFTPLVGLQYNQFKYFSQFGEYQSEIPLVDYLNMNNIDLSFRQMSGTVGSHIDIKIFSSYYSPYSFTSSGYLGIGAGYMFNFHRRPWIKTAGNEITSNGRIDLNSFFFQINFKILFHE